VTRIRNITSNSFQLRIQGWEDGPASTNNVHCMIMDEGAHKLPDGRLVEAHSVLSDKTVGQYALDGNWNQANMEDVSASIVHTYNKPVVVGQVMSYNDPRASVISLSDCDNQRNNPFHQNQADGICVGKHIGMIRSTRADETIGYIVGEAGSGTINNVFYELAFGPDIVYGKTNGDPGFYYTGLQKHHTIAVLTQGGEDGGNGSWAVLYGDTPLENGRMTLAVDEEIFAGDSSRVHTNEPVYYWAFAGAEITLVKNLINDSGGPATLADFELTATAPDTISGISGSTAVTKAVVTPGDYVLSETQVPGYIASDWTCTGATRFRRGSITVVGGDHAVCTITNEDGDFSTLTLVKEVTNNQGGTAVVSDFVLTFDGEGVVGSGITGAAAVTDAAVPPGNYTLTENSIPGYVQDNLECDGRDRNVTNGLKIFPGERVKCKFYNIDKEFVAVPKDIDLAIVKSVNDLTPNIGDTVTFKIEITNNGPDTALDFHVTDPVRAGFSYIASSMTGGDAQNDSSPAGTGLDWTINTLPVGSSVVLTFQATVLPR